MDNSILCNPTFEEFNFFKNDERTIKTNPEGAS